VRIALGSDEKTLLTDALVEDLLQRGHEVVLVGPLAPAAAGDTDVDWPVTSARVARAVAAAEADQGIVCCWTGTGASIAANKIAGARAALCGDAETARGARRYNDANVLALSLRATSPAIAREILDAWFVTTPDDDSWNEAQLARVRELDAAR
jgi:ribose 5-phosphate isomerase B